MSTVHNYTLFLELVANREHKLAELNQHLGERHSFKCVKYSAGGVKNMEHEIWCLASWMPHEDIIEAILKVEWDDPDTMVLVYKEQFDDEFTILKGLSNFKEQS